MKYKFKNKVLKAASLIIAVLFTSGCAADPGSFKEQTISSSQSESSATGVLTATIMSIGAADSIIVTCGGKTMLIDCGEAEDSTKIIKKLNKQGIETIDFLVITHFDKDHVGGAADIFSEFNIGIVYQPDYAKESTTFNAYTQALTEYAVTPIVPTQDITVQLGEATVVISPPQQVQYDQSNDYSIICRAYFGENSLLFMGDAEEIRTNEFLSSCTETFDFIKMPHHGRLSDTTSALIQSAAPKYAAITCSKSSPADGEVLSMLEIAGCAYYLTTDGVVTVTCTAQKMTVEQ